MKSGTADTTDEPTLRGMYWMVDRWRQSSAYTNLTLEQQAGYRNLLDELWLRGGAIPNDPRILARACGDPLRWRFIRTAVLKFFQVDGDVLRNKTLTAVRHESRRRAINQRNWRRRHGDNGTGNGTDNGTDNAGDNGTDNAPDNGPVTMPITRRSHRR